MKTERKLKNYSKHFDEISFFKKIVSITENTGKNIVFYALILYFLLTDKDIPIRTRIIILAALGYFILPTDLIADFLPGIGFTDDLSFITYALTEGTDHISDEIIAKAKLKLNRLFSKNNN
jgi:uncharacterized membrane protein YkvA (DUF1232 family)